MPWLLGYDMTPSALKEFKRIHGHREQHNTWEPVYNELIKVLGWIPTTSYADNAAGELTSVIYFHQTYKEEPQLDPDNPNMPVPTKAQILQLRRVFGRREMWYWDWDRYKTALPPRRAIYGDDELDKEDQLAVWERMETLAIREDEEEEEAAEGAGQFEDSMAGPS